MRAGCRNIFLRLGTLAVSAVLVAVGVLLLLLGYFSLESPVNLETVILLFAAVAAAYVFIRVGRDIWRDLREQLPGRKEADEPQGPGEDPGDEDSGPPPAS